MKTTDVIRGLAQLPDRPKMPALFVGHGSPTNTIEDNEFSQAWEEMGKDLPRPTAILCVSAHWETDGTQVTAMAQPRTIHDFSGFPAELYQVQYPAPGSPELAAIIQEVIHQTRVKLDQNWGLDHGTWSILHKMFPKADIPVLQLSLDRTQEPAFHYALGQELKVLRQKGILILGSGNVVHNLRTIVWQNVALDWAGEFDEMIKQSILAEDHQSIIH